MWTRNQRQAAARLFLKRLGLVGLFAFVLVAASGVWGVYEKERESSERRREAEAELNDLLLRKEKLSSEMEKLKSDRGLEETLRKQFGLAEHGEGLIVIVEQGPATSASATSTFRDWLRQTFWRP